MNRSHPSSLIERDQLQFITHSHVQHWLPLAICQINFTVSYLCNMYISLADLVCTQKYFASKLPKTRFKILLSVKSFQSLFKHAQCTSPIVLLFLGHNIIHERDEHLQIDISHGDGNIQKIFLRDKFFHNPKPSKRLRRKTWNKIAPPLLQRLEQSEYDF